MRGCWQIAMPPLPPCSGLSEWVCHIHREGRAAGAALSPLVYICVRVCGCVRRWLIAPRHNGPDSPPPLLSLRLTSPETPTINSPQRPSPLKHQDPRTHPMSCHQTYHNLGGASPASFLCSLSIHFPSPSLSLSLSISTIFLCPILVLPASPPLPHMWPVPSNAEWVWEYGLNVRMENTVCVFTLHCSGPLRQHASSECWLQMEKTRGRTTRAAQAFSSSAPL